MNGAEVRTHSAVHVLKGAVIKILGARLTTSVHVSENRGLLNVEFGRKPTNEEIAKLEAEANRKIGEDSEILQFEMDKEEAEGHFGQGIYDAFRVPVEVTRLKIVRIPEWETNCCVMKHVETTSEIGRLKINRVRFRNAKHLLEIEFHIEP
ncbi:MAG: alanyl-tRNA editing protein [Thaumarchaeota archaeon]|nr:alanyl-tRNA editing protein [Nitrososphaerota archaeon]